MEANFGGCEAAGWCRFMIEPSVGLAQQPWRVRPDGVTDGRGDEVLALAVRDRLNALLSSMIHQHKRIRLQGLRDLGDGTYAGIVTVNESDVASDPWLLELGAEAAAAPR
jgi:hypothetical protein